MDTQIALPDIIYCSQAVRVSMDIAGTCGFIQKAAVISIKFSIVIITQSVPQLENQTWEVF